MLHPRVTHRAWREFACALVLCCAVGTATAQTEALVPTPIGVGQAYHPGVGSVSGSAIHGLRCTRTAVPRFGVHLELFADRQVVLLPSGIGVAPPRTLVGGVVTLGRCSYPIRTTDPTGLIQVAAGARATLGDLFAVWRRELGPRRLLGFSGAVQAYVDGLPQEGDPRLLRLTRHAEIVLEIGGYVPPHQGYLFPRDL